MVYFMSRRSRGALGGGWTEAESGVSQTSLGALLGAQTEAELTAIITYSFCITKTPTPFMPLQFPTEKVPAFAMHGWETTQKLLVHNGHPPELHILDNECSQAALKDAVTKNKINFQRVPPKEH